MDFFLTVLTNIINDDLRNQRKKKPNPENVNIDLLHIGEKTKHLSMIGLAPTKRSDKTVAPKQSSPLDDRAGFGVTFVMVSPRWK